MRKCISYFNLSRNRISRNGFNIKNHTINLIANKFPAYRAIVEIQSEENKKVFKNSEYIPQNSYSNLMNHPRLKSWLENTNIDNSESLDKYNEFDNVVVTDFTIHDLPNLATILKNMKSEVLLDINTRRSLEESTKKISKVKQNKKKIEKQEIESSISTNKVKYINSKQNVRNMLNESRIISLTKEGYLVIKQEANNKESNIALPYESVVSSVSRKYINILLLDSLNQ